MKDDCLIMSSTRTIDMPKWTGKKMRPQPYSKTSTQLRNAESKRITIPKEKNTQIGDAMPNGQS